MEKYLLALSLSGLILALAFTPFAGSQTSYDPWADINDDGKISMDDIMATVTLFGTKGDPAKPVTIAGYQAKEWNMTASLNPGQSFNFENSTLGFKTLTISVDGITYNSAAASHDYLYIIIYFLVENVAIRREVVKIHPKYYLMFEPWPPPEGTTYRGFTNTYSIYYSTVKVTLYAHFDNYAPINAYVVCYMSA